MAWSYIQDNDKKDLIPSWCHMVLHEGFSRVCLHKEYMWLESLIYLVFYLIDINVGYINDMLKVEAL